MFWFFMKSCTAKRGTLFFSGLPTFILIGTVYGLESCPAVLLLRVSLTYWLIPGLTLAAAGYLCGLDC